MLCTTELGGIDFETDPVPKTKTPDPNPVRPQILDSEFGSGSVPVSAMLLQIRIRVHLWCITYINDGTVSRWNFVVNMHLQCKQIMNINIIKIKTSFSKKPIISRL